MALDKVFFICFTSKMDKLNRLNLMHLFRWATLLFVFWLLLSGFIQPLLLSFGVISVAIVLVVLQRMDKVDNEVMVVSANFKTLHYLIWLIGQIVQSSVHVTKLIWGSNDKVSPALAKVPVKNMSDKHHVLYANSITLTPGTLSVDVSPNEVTVHALQEQSIKDLEDGQMENKITGIWGESK